MKYCTLLKKYFIHGPPQRLISSSAIGVDVNTHFCLTFFTSLIQPSSTSLKTQFMYYIIFYYFKHGPIPCDILGEIDKMWFGGYGSVSFGLFALVQTMRATKWVRDTGSTSGS